MTARWSTCPLDRRCLLKRGRDGILGFAAFDPDHPDGVFLDNMHVRPGYGGMGPCRALMQAVCNVAARRPVWLDVLADTERARAVGRGWGGREGAEVDGETLGHAVRLRHVDWPDASAQETRLPAAVAP
jgi:hypothetical protein